MTEWGKSLIGSWRLWGALTKEKKRKGKKKEKARGRGNGRPLAAHSGFSFDVLISHHGPPIKAGTAGTERKEKRERNWKGKKPI